MYLGVLSHYSSEGWLTSTNPMNTSCDIPFVAHVAVSDTAFIGCLSDLSVPVAFKLNLCSSAAAVVHSSH